MQERLDLDSFNFEQNVEDNLPETIMQEEILPETIA